ncbi:MAG TPA: glycosyltransferase [Verrucomicrobiae bacterium]|nr:glycosyltransferase [Verrucomicrobiae bacterium]
MRVTHVITRLVVGGAQENTVATVLGLLKQPGFQVDLLSGPETGPEGTLEAAFTPHPGVLRFVPDLVRPVHPWKDAAAYRRLVTLLRELRPDIVHTHSGKAGILGRLAARKAGVPIILHHIHGPSFGTFQGALPNAVFTAAERYAAKATTHFLCSASAMSRLYLQAGIGTPEMYTRVFSGFQIEPFLAAANDPDLRRKLNLPADAFVIGKIARLAPLKGHEDALRVMKKLLPAVPQARLLLIGGGPLLEHLKQRVAELGLEGKVIFTGLVAPSDVPRYVGLLDCLAHLSAREAVSRALPQALAAGKPVVAYEFDGADEVCFEGETGFLAEMGGIETVVRRLKELAASPELRTRLGNRGREIVAREFPVERMVETIARLYATLAANKNLRLPQVKAPGNPDPRQIEATDPLFRRRRL